MQKTPFVLAAELLRDWARDRAAECALSGDIDGWAKWYAKFIWHSTNPALHSR